MLPKLFDFLFELHKRFVETIVRLCIHSSALHVAGGIRHYISPYRMTIEVHLYVLWNSHDLIH